MFERSQVGLPRTNNSVEAWHRAFQGSIQGAHPTMWRFIEAIRREQNFQQATLAQVLAGNQVRREYEALNRRLDRLLQERRNMGVLPFLRGIAHNIEINV